MHMDRRAFVASAAGLAAAHANTLQSDLSHARADFPWSASQTYLNTATEHPIGLHSSEAMQEYLHALSYGPDSARDKFENGHLMVECKRMFAELIHAKPSEIGFTPSTQTGENIVIEGLGIQESGSNVVTNDLHYEGSLINYRRRRETGMDVRIVPSRDYQVDMRDLEKAVNNKTRLIAIALVSNVNGYLHDVKKISDLAHAHGAYVYTDVIQCAGAIPIDVNAMGIDFLSCSAYKWLMGGRFGYLYVREDLQGAVLKPRLMGGRSTLQGASRYEISTASHLGCVCQSEALKYIQRCGIDRIRAHARPLTARLQKELPAAGYPCITPKGNESPIVTFHLSDAAAVKAKLHKANIVATVRVNPKGDGQMRVSCSVFNNDADISRMIETLS